MSIRNTTPNVVKMQLRKEKSIPSAVKAILYANCTGPMAAGQFHQDVMTYNLWEALLYVEGYEKQFYNEGTAEKAIKAIIDTKKYQKLIINSMPK